MKNLFPLLGLIIAFGCQEKAAQEISTDYSIKLDDGIYVEVFDSNYVDENRYTINNKVFLEGRTFVYKFYHQTLAGEKKSFKHDQSVQDYAKAWKFLDMNSTDEGKVELVKISVKAGLEPFIQSLPDYNQSIVKYDYTLKEKIAPFNSMSGVIENENNIWIHPPRDKYFRILELNPFPFIQMPYEVGNTWTWELTIGGVWGDTRWKTWEGNITNSYQYEISDKRMISSPFGEIECFEISSTATSTLGSTELLALFSFEYGFVNLDYTNIDGTKTVLELVEVQGPAQVAPTE